MNDFIDTVSNGLKEWVQGLAPDVPGQLLGYGGAIILGGLALILVIIALRLFRSKGGRASTKRVNIPKIIQQEGSVVDVSTSQDTDDISTRCVFTSVSSGKIKCEVIDRLKPLDAKKGDLITCIFAPKKTVSDKVNAFVSTVIESEADGRNPDRIVLSVPQKFTLMPRRKHARKRVADQQFIRVKLWIDDPFSSDIPFQDATPHISVNSFNSENSTNNANAVLNISHGGIGLSVHNTNLNENCAVGAPVAINLFMFNFREKTFKPYWYAGEIRTMHEGRLGTTRLGVKFTGYGEPEDGSLVRWALFD